MKEPIDKKFSIINKHSKPEPGIVYTLPDGSTTIWLNEYVDAMVQAKVDEIVNIIKDIEYHGTTHSEHCYNRHAFAEILIERITGETND